ncbi:phytoene dehydrogenase-like protein [Variovorax boronicumulans]|uniref:Pyridine nucleotide-disulfide oxidoreductase domain-containing protein 2 n=1 Tax=Variovorax boronicumulans TaxID=436515 RepID=A0AAW8DC05_9BURK|nr:NAD(P)/FAD-dependent oxidoreductase [Variovorax boronicumulans]MDP9896870.1 phytoene dehydrogenase-like protein [Variovorax boronicumulans]MDQ0056806.1 phytoene dehydrogenase-like protein [Variovorax boronicumulans]
MRSSRSRPYDVLLVGSGINSLVCAALLARDGRKVCVLEREAVLGGCIRTDELTLPGFFHDTLSAAHSTFMVGPAYAALGKALHEAGLQYCNAEAPTAVLTPDGRSLILGRSREANIQRFEAAHTGDGAAYAAALDEVATQAPLIFSLLGKELWRLGTAKTLASEAIKQGAFALSGFLGQSLTPARGWLESNFQSDLSGALLAPWVLHCGIGPDAPLSALMAKVLTFTLEAVGTPLVKGGNANTVRAFEHLIRKAGGELHTSTDVTRVIVERGKAVGVRLIDGREFRAKEVVCNVTPTQLYQRLLDPKLLPADVATQARQWRYGRGIMQIHLALSEAPQWPDSALSGVGYVHLTSGVNAISRAVNEADRGLLPAEPTICVAQPTALDPSRAPPGRHILWIQLIECPREPVGDAAGVLETPPGKRWTPALREAYADRVIEQLSRQIPNLKSSLLSRAVLSPADLEALNINLVGGDAFGGDCSLDQSFLWRPMRAARNHATHVGHLWHIGASTHPGPGLSGGSGFLLAKALGAV